MAKVKEIKKMLGTKPPEVEREEKKKKMAAQIADVKPVDTKRKGSKLKYMETMPGSGESYTSG